MQFKISKYKDLYQNKFLLTLIVFGMWLVFFDSNSLLDRWEWLNEVRQLKNEKEYNLERIQHDNARLEELRTNNKNLEKFAREQYFMKKKNEDIFIIVED